MLYIYVDMYNIFRMFHHYRNKKTWLLLLFLNYPLFSKTRIKKFESSIMIWKITCDMCKYWCKYCGYKDLCILCCRIDTLQFIIDMSISTYIIYTRVFKIYLTFIKPETHCPESVHIDFNLYCFWKIVVPVCIYNDSYNM